MTPQEQSLLLAHQEREAAYVFAMLMLKIGVGMGIGLPAAPVVERRAP